MITQQISENNYMQNESSNISEILNEMLSEAYSSSTNINYEKLDNTYFPANDMAGAIGGNAMIDNAMQFKSKCKDIRTSYGMTFEEENNFTNNLPLMDLQSFEQVQQTFQTSFNQDSDNDFNNQPKPQIENQNEYQNYYFLNHHVEKFELKEPTINEKTEPVIQESGSSFDPNMVRNDFPILKQKVNGKNLVWFDNAATTQKPNIVIDTISDYYRTINSNIHRGAHTLAALSTEAYENARETIKDFLGAKSANEIILVRGTSEGINLIANTYGKRFLRPGDEILIPELEHHANIVPWQMIAKETGAIIRKIPINDKGDIDIDAYANLLSNKSKIFTVCKVSNSLGTINPVKQMIQMAHHAGAIAIVDGAQSVAHSETNVTEMNADFFVFSGHKIYGPTGIGAVYGKEELLGMMPPWQGGGNMIKDVTFEETQYNTYPAKFEAGTPNVADAVGLGAALRYLKELGLPSIEQYELNLTRYAMKEMLKVPGLKLIGTSDNKISVLSFIIKGMENETIGKALDREGIEVRVGHHCAQPSLRHFGLEKTVRPSLAMYNTKDEVDKMVNILLKMTT